MDLLGGYGSDSDSDADAVPSAAVPKKRKVDFSKLPVSRPLLVTGPSGAEEEAPLKSAASMADSLSSRGLGKSLLSSLPPPKVGYEALGAGSGGSSRIQLDLDRAPRRVDPLSGDLERPSEALLPGDKFRDLSEEEMTQKLRSHPMVMGGSRKDYNGDGPSEEERHRMKSVRNFTAISADEMRDPDWMMNAAVASNGLGGPACAGTKVPNESSGYERANWGTTTHADPSRVQKRKHQINWLASEAMEKEAEMLDRDSAGRLSKSQTMMKYGW